LGAHELAVEVRVATFEEHPNHLGKIPLQLVERFALTMCAWKPWNLPNIESGLGIAFDHGGIGLHRQNPGRRSFLNLRAEPRSV
jgi:hypothetical protein